MRNIIFGLLVLTIIVVSGCELTQEDPQLAMQMEIALPGGGGSGGVVVHQTEAIGEFTISLDGSSDIVDEDNGNLSIDDSPVIILDKSFYNSGYFTITTREGIDVSSGEEIDSVYFAFDNENLQGFMDPTFLIYENGDGYHFLEGEWENYLVKAHNRIGQDVEIMPDLVDGSLIISGGSLLPNHRIQARVIGLGERESWAAYDSFGYFSNQAEEGELVVYNWEQNGQPNYYNIGFANGDYEVTQSVIFRSPKQNLEFDEIVFSLLLQN